MTMPKIPKGVWIALLVLVVIAGVYMGFQGEINDFLNRKFGDDVPDPDKLPEKEKEAAYKAADLDKKLSLGSKGTEVIMLQKMLVRDGGELPKFGTDGKFGKETEAALLKVSASPPLVGIKSITLREYGKSKWQRVNTGIAGGTKMPPINANNYENAGGLIVN